MTGGVYREIVPDEKLVLAWGATDGWPKLDPDRLDDSPQVTVRPGRGRRAHGDESSRRATREHADDGVQDWWSMFQDGLRDTVDRLAAALAIHRQWSDLSRKTRNPPAGGFREVRR